MCSSDLFLLWHAVDDEVHLPAIPKQKELAKREYHEAAQTQLEDLINTDPLAKAWWLSGCYRGSLNAFNIAASVSLLDEHAFQSCLCQRLLMPSPVTAPYRCSRCHQIGQHDEDEGAMDARFHGLHCSQCQNIRTSRHNYVRDTLAKLLIRLFGNHAVCIEPHLGEDLLRPDIKLLHGDSYTLIDVTIVNPACARSLRLNSSSITRAAADAAETSKRDKYAPTMAALHLADGHLVPFAFECTGHMGKAAEQFLDRLQQLPGFKPNEKQATKTIRYFLSHIRCQILLGNAKCSAAAYLQQLMPMD